MKEFDSLLHCCLFEFSSAIVLRRLCGAEKRCEPTPCNELPDCSA